MFHRVATVALNTYREAVRARILLGMAGVALAAAFYSLVVGAFTIEDAPRVVADLGAATISVFSVAVAVLIGATALHRELEMKTILPLLARPIRRAEYLVGKFLGTMLVVLVFVMAEAGVVLLMCSVMGGRSPALAIGVGAALWLVLGVAAVRSSRARTFGPIVWSLAMLLGGFFLCSVARAEQSLVMASATLTLCEVSIVAALAMLFSSFSTPFLSSLLTLGSFVVGRSADSLTRLPRKFFGEEIHQAGKMLAKVVPNLHTYVPARPLLTQEAADADLLRYLAMGGVQSLGWTLLLLTFAAMIFNRRDFI